MANYQLKAEPRTAVGTAAAKRLRHQRLVPANVYGRDKANALISIELQEMEKALASGEHLIDLNIGDEERVVIVKEVQKEPIKGYIQHVDFYEVSMDRAIDTTVPIIVEGTSASEEGVVNHVLRELSISCLPGAIPDNITVDITGMVIGDSIQVANLDIPEGITVINEPDEAVVSIAAPTEIVEEEPEEEVDVELDADGLEVETEEEEAEAEESDED